MNEVHDLEGKKRRFFEQGVNAPGTLEKQVYVRKFKEVDSRAKNKGILLGTLSLQTQLIDGLIQVKEMKDTLDEIGIGSIVEDLELSQLSKYVDDSTIDGQFNAEKFKQMIIVLNGGGIEKPVTRDEDEDELLRMMEQASDARDNPELMDQAYANANSFLVSKQKNQENPFTEDEG
jgi:hypothetical protein